MERCFKLAERDGDRGNENDAIETEYLGEVAGAWRGWEVGRAGACVGDGAGVGHTCGTRSHQRAHLVDARHRKFVHE